MGQTQSELNNKLAEACLKGNLEKVKKYIAEGAKPNTLYRFMVNKCLQHDMYYGKYLLEYLIIGNPVNLEVVEYLLEKGAIGSSAVTPDYKNKKLIELLDKYDIYCKYSIRDLSDDEICNVFSSGKRIPDGNDLYYAMTYKKYETAIFLLEKGARISLETIQYIHIYPKLLEKCDDNKILNKAFEKYFENGDLEICDKILEKIKDLKYKLNLSYYYCNNKFIGRITEKYVEYLLNVLEKDTITDGTCLSEFLEKLLIYYMTHSDVNKCTLVLNKIKSVNSIVSITTGNLKAAKDSEKIKFIIDLILDYKLCNIFFVLESGNIPLIEEYLNRTENKEVNCTNSEYKTVLEVAETYNDPKLIQILIQRGARFEPSVKLKDFFEAVKQGKVKDVKRMMNLGVNYKVKYEGKDILKCAMESRNIDMIDLITKILVDGVEWLQEMGDEKEEVSEEEVENEGIPEILSTLPSAPIISNEPGNQQILA